MHYTQPSPIQIFSPSSSMCTRDEEQKWNQQGYKCIVGVDEAGCGCLAGPVTVCACFIPITVDIVGINDSKKLSEKKRETLFEQLTTDTKVKYAVIHIDAPKIDEINILQVCGVCGEVDCSENVVWWGCV